jgi:hypothetical protein
MPRIMKTVTTEHGYGCDRCGKVISDGQHDGLGGINWWGMEIALQDSPEEKLDITVYRTWEERVEVRVRNIGLTGRREPFGPRWLVCRECGKAIEEVIGQTIAAGQATSGGSQPNDLTPGEWIGEGRGMGGLAIDRELQRGLQGGQSSAGQIPGEPR